MTQPGQTQPSDGTGASGAIAADESWHDYQLTGLALHLLYPDSTPADRDAATALWRSVNSDPFQHGGLEGLFLGLHDLRDHGWTRQDVEALAEHVGRRNPQGPWQPTDATADHLRRSLASLLSAASTAIDGLRRATPPSRRHEPVPFDRADAEAWIDALVEWENVRIGRRDPRRLSLIHFAQACEDHDVDPGDIADLIDLWCQALTGQAALAATCVRAGLHVDEALALVDNDTLDTAALTALAALRSA